MTKSTTRMISYVFRFMLIFEINRFWVFSASETSVKARVGWADDGVPDYDEDEEVQDIEWDVQCFDNFEDALELSEYLIDNKLIRVDKITIDREELCNRISWGKDRYDAAINTLLRIKIDMLDNGRKTDYFFIHF